MALPELVLDRNARVLLAQYISVAGKSPAATGADKVLASFVLPASTFKETGDGIHIECYGGFAATGNNKNLKIIFKPDTATVDSTVGANGTTVLSTGTVATNGGGFLLSADIVRTGGNAQLAIGFSVCGPGSSAAGACEVTAPTTPAGTEVNNMFLAITGNATTAASDILLNLVNIYGLR